MSFGALLLLSVGLAMDATAVSAARGLAAPRLLPQHLLVVPLLFGGFQAFMPWMGWLVGSELGPMVQRVDHWIAFVLLGAVGGKMLYEAITAGAEPAPQPRDLFRLEVLVALAVATSIDALAAGVTLPLLGAPLVLSLATIGVTTALLSAAGLLLGRRFGAALGKRLDVAGGLLLLALGTKILIQHLAEG